MQSFTAICQISWAYVVSAQGVAPDPDKIRAVRDRFLPQTVKENVTAWWDLHHTTGSS